MKAKLKSWLEYDVYTGWRRYVNVKPKLKRWIKRKFHKRERKTTKMEIKRGWRDE